MKMAQWSLIGALFFAFCVNAAKQEDKWVNPLAFITMQTTSEDALKYGFQLLEDVRQTRMSCMERRDELERQFAKELETWTKYSQQTQQVISGEGFERYGVENREILEKNLQMGFKEMYNGRSRRLQTIQTQCDNDLEELLQTRKVSLLSRTAQLMANKPETLKHLMQELLSYDSQLQEGVQHCIHTQAAQFESRFTSRLNQPEDYCYATDINIVNIFIQNMVHLIQEEQMSFFGDDEDLVNNGPCGMSGCEEPHVVTTERIPTERIPTVTDSGITDSTHSEATEATVHTVPPSRTPITDHTTKPSSASNEPPTLPSLTSTTDEKPPTTKPPLTTPHTQDPPTSEEMQTSPTSPDPKVPESTPHTTASPPTTTSDKTSPPDTPSPRTELPPPTTVSAPTTTKTVMTEKTNPPATAPVWLEDAFDEVFHGPQKQQQAASTVVDVEVGNGAVEVTMDVEVDTNEETVESDVDPDNEDSHSHSHDDSTDGDRSNSRSESRGSDGDHQSRSGGRHDGSKHGNPQEIVVDISPYFPDDAENQAEQVDNSDDSSDSSNTYRILIYSFTAVGGVMVVAALVLVVAIVAVQHKRRQLLASQLLTQEQKIAIMKQTGYVNPTYKFFDQHKDS